MTKELQAAMYMLQNCFSAIMVHEGLMERKDASKPLSFANLQATALLYEKTNIIAITDDDWKELRDMGWTYSSSKSKCIEKLRKWFVAYPKYSMANVKEACQLYVNICIEDDKYTRKLQNFVFSTSKQKTTTSDLLHWVQIVVGEKAYEEQAA